MSSSKSMFTLRCRRITARCTVPEGATTIGLHAFQLAIRAVAVNGVPVPFHTVPYQWEPLPQGVLEAGGSKLDAAYRSAAEDTAAEYVRFLRQEEHPELVCQVRVPRQAHDLLAQ